MRIRNLIGTIPAAVLLAALTATAAQAIPATGGGSVSTQACTQQSILDGTHFTDVQIAQTAKSHGFTGNGLVISVAVSLAESSGWTRAVLINTDCSRDRGLWQISSFWHSEVSDAQAFDPNGAAQATFTISSSGTNWTPWVTFNNGAYQQFMARAQQAVNQIGGGGGGGGGGCAALATWNSGSVYTGGMNVSFNQHRWTAKWWTQGEQPGTTGQWGVWTDNGPC